MPLNKLIKSKVGIVVIYLCLPPLSFSQSAPLFYKSSLASLRSLNSNFVGREKELKKLENAAVTKPNDIKILMGFPGIGKTALTRQYVIRNYHHFDGVIWLEGKRDIKEQLLEFAIKWNELYKEKEIPAYYLTTTSINNMFNEWFAQRPERILIVLDDFNNPQQTAQIVKNLAYIKNKFTILTTKNAYYKKDYEMHVTKLPRDDSVKLLQNYIPTETYDTLNQLAEVLGDYPLALKHAGFVLKTSSTLTVSKLCELFRNKRQIFNSLESNMAETESGCDYKMTVASIIDFTLEELKNKSPLSYEALKALSYIGINDFSSKIIEEWLDQNGHDVDKVHEISAHLSSRFLIEEKGRDKDSVTYQMHGVIGQIINDSIKDKEQKTYIENWINLFNKKFNVEAYELENIVTNCKEYYDHAHHIIQRCEKLNLTNNDVVELEIHLFHMAFFNAYDADLSKHLFELLPSHVAKSKINEFILSRYYIVRSNYLSQYDMNEAIQTSEKGLEILKPINELKAKVEAFFAITNNLVDFYIARGEVKRAEKLCSEAEQYLKEFKNPAYSILFHFANSLMLTNKGDYELALNQINKALSIVKESNLSENIYLFLKVAKMENLTRLGRYEDSFSFGQELLEAMKKVFPSIDMYLPLKARVLMIWNELNLNRNRSLSGPMEEIIQKYKDFFNGITDRDPMQVMSHMVLGDIYIAENMHEKAFESYKFAHHIYEKILLKREIVTLSDIYVRLVKTSIVLNDEENAALYFHKQIDDYGSDHINTRQLIEYLDKNNIRIP